MTMLEVKLIKEAGNIASVDGNSGVMYNKSVSRDVSKSWILNAWSSVESEGNAVSIIVGGETVKV
jgi:hypothetical protein